MTYWQDHCNLPVSKEIRKQLNDLGHKGETYDAILTRLIESYKQHMAEA